MVAAACSEHGSTLAAAAAQGLDLDLTANALFLVHGWTDGPVLLEFVGKLLGPLSRRSMTVAELAAEAKASEGPLVLTLRTCCILEYVSFDEGTGTYTLVRSEELDELERTLRSGTPLAEALRSAHAEAVPPFKAASEEAKHCLRLWREHRRQWRSSKSSVLPLLLDGVVLAPLLASITYGERWNEDGSERDRDSHMDSLDFSQLDAESRAALSEIFTELRLGSMDSRGIVTLSSKDALALQYSRVMSQHLVRKPFRIRFAELTDLPALERLEASAWSEEMRAPSAVLRARLERSPATNFVCEMDGRVVAVLYTQMVQGIDVADTQSFMEISDTHDADGRILQIISLCVDPEELGLGIGSSLRSFVLHLARLDPAVDCVIGVTRCRDFKNFTGRMQTYVDRHVAGQMQDPTLAFHTGSGAQVVKIVRNFRPEDSENNGIGVLIKYDVKEWSSSAATTALQALEDEKIVLTSADLICDIMEGLGYREARATPTRDFFDYGLDSLDMVRIRNKLSGTLGMELPATLLLDFSSVQLLGEALDKERGLHRGQDSLVEIEEQLPKQWASLNSMQVLEILDREKRLLATPQYQRRFNEMAKKCYPDMCKYTLMISDTMAEIQGSIFFTYGLTKDTHRTTVKQGLAEWMECLMKHWSGQPEIRIRHHEILHLSKQDQSWS